MNKRVDFDEHTEKYNQLLREGTSFFSANEAYFAEYKVSIVKERAKPSVSCLHEFGCGIGRNIAYLQKAFPGAGVIGADISAGSIDVARRENPEAKFFVEGADAAPETKFDLIFVAGVFHHVPPTQRAEVMSTICSRLSPGGELFVFEHNPYNPVTRRIVSNCVYDEDAELLTPRALKELCTQAGLNVKKHEYCLFVPPKLSAMSWLENLLGWLPLGGQYWVKADKPT